MSPVTETAEGATALRLVRPVALVGLMGCGKSTVGARVAAQMGARFADADAEIAAAAGMTIPEIFSALGEPAFRDGERRVISRLLGDGPLVLATGGGAYMDAETRAAISAVGVAVWLRADLDTLVERTGRKSTRPLLRQGDPREILSGLIETRYPVYAGAEVTVESPAQGAADGVARRVAAALAEWSAANPDRAVTETAS